MRIGVACGSNERSLIPVLTRLTNHGMLDYVELYVQEDESDYASEDWKKSSMEFTIHVPHYESANTTVEMLNKARTWATNLQAKRLIYDAGTLGMTDLPQSDDLFAENMPMYTSFGEKSNLAYPDPKYKNICLDFAHAFMVANNVGHGMTVEILWQNFLDTKPRHFHVANTSSLDYDDHCALDKGLLNIRQMIALIPEDGWVTIEPNHEGENRVERMLSDINYFHSCLKPLPSYKPE